MNNLWGHEFLPGMGLEDTKVVEVEKILFFPLSNPADVRGALLIYHFNF